MKALHLASVVWLFLTSPAIAGGDDGTGPFEPFDAEPIIADCWQRSAELRSSGYIDYGDGLNITYACMEAAVLEQIDAWLLPEFTEHAKTHLDALEELHGQLYYRIYAENLYCSGFCGLLPSMRYIESYITFLETVLRDIAEEKNFRYRSRYGSSPHNALSGGQKEPNEPIDAQALIDACWSETNRQRTSGEAGEKESVAYLLECHKSHILRLTDHMFDPELLSRRDVHRILVKLHHNIGKFYTYLFHEHKRCGCDGDIDVTYDLAMAKAYQRILHHVVYQYNRYRF
ncbi:MAG: hypothetical protein ACFCUT_21115 [Kiloniellaceae bacterium]